MCTPTGSNSYQQRVHVRYLKLLCHRKWLILAVILLCITIALVLMQHAASTSIAEVHDAYMDDVPQELYQEVLRNWYNFTNEDKWYNNQKNASIWRNPALLSELLLNWIIWRYYESKPYNLLQPDVEDPSMGQARKIRDIFNDKKGGFFIECGAYDGETRSNTLVLERLLGWNGLLIEADPINFTKMLQKNRKAFLSPTCLSVHTYPVIASFLMARNIGRLHDTTNSTENTPKNTADVAHSGDHVNVQCFPLASYIAALDVKTVDYFSLDIEGNEIDVLETIPFDQVDIKTLSVEHIHNSKGRQYLIDLMDKRGYYVHSLVERADNLANDVIFVKREA